MFFVEFVVVVRFAVFVYGFGCFFGRRFLVFVGVSFSFFGVGFLIVVFRICLSFIIRRFRFLDFRRRGGFSVFFVVVREGVGRGGGVGSGFWRGGRFLVVFVRVGVLGL